MKKLLKDYYRLKSESKDVQQTLNLMEAYEPLPFRGRAQKDCVVGLDEARMYLYALLEEIEIRCVEVKKLIVAKVLKEKEKYFEFSPYKNAGKTDDYIQNTQFGLYQYQGNLYLTVGCTNDELSLVFIYTDLTVAIDAYYTECQLFIAMRKKIDNELQEFNDVPVYAEIIKHFEPLVDDEYQLWEEQSLNDYQRMIYDDEELFKDGE